MSTAKLPPLILFLSFLLLVSTTPSWAVDLLGEEAEEVIADSGEQLPLDDDAQPYSIAEGFEEGEADGVVLDGDRLVLQEKEGAEGYRNKGQFVSGVISAQALFNAIMLAHNAQLPPGTVATTYVRVIDENGNPGEWIALGKEDGILLNGDFQKYQYRVVMRSPSGSASPSISGLSLQTERTRNYPQDYERAPITDVGAPQIIERSQWGARRAASSGSMTPREIVIHHTASPMSSYRGAASIRQVQNYHMNSNHWRDIGYHFLIGPDGKIYRGRSENRVGAHAPPNSGRLGISLVGNFQNDRLSRSAQSALVSLLGYLCGRYGISERAVKAHRDVGQTACPGRNVMSRFSSLKSAGVAAAGR